MNFVPPRSNRFTRATALAILSFSLGSLAHAADPAPATSATGQHTWDMPAVTVVGEKPAQYSEDEKIGSYNQPRWTADRLFSRNRVYVIPENKVEVEYWLRTDIPRHGGPVETQHMLEAEIGLPHRFQLDLYAIARSEGGSETFFDQAFELRYALAEWGKIFGNPALYAEYVHRQFIADKVELKLLLGGDLGPGWHWATNLVYEGETSEDLTNEYSATFGVSRTVIDGKLELGVEAEVAFSDTRDGRGDFSKEYYVGPSIQWRPLPAMHLDFAPLIGVNDDSEAAKIFFIAGWEF